MSSPQAVDEIPITFVPPRFRRANENKKLHGVFSVQNFL
jgi:hypothetical protein